MQGIFFNEDNNKAQLKQKVEEKQASPYDKQKNITKRPKPVNKPLHSLITIV